MIAASLVAASVCFGVLAVWVFRRTADRAALRRTGKRLYGHLLEFRLFYDEPVLIWRAQMAFARENFRLLLLLVRPTLATLPVAWLVLQLETVYGHAPLAVGRPAVVTAQISRDLSPRDSGAILKGPPGLSIETPPVRSLVDRQISWRIRPLRPFCGTLDVEILRAVVRKSICAGTRGVFLVPRRAHSLISFLIHPEEGRLPSGEIAWMELDYPETDVSIAGLTLPWMAWFVIFSIGGAAGFEFLAQLHHRGHRTAPIGHIAHDADAGGGRRSGADG